MHLEGRVLFKEMDITSVTGMAGIAAWGSVCRATVVASALAALCAAATPAAAQPPPNPYHPPLTAAMPPLDVLVAQFERVAFSSEFGGSNRRGRVIKWARPLRVRISGWRSERSRPVVRDVLARLSALSGLQIDLLDPDESTAANLTILFRDKGLPGQALCNTFIDEYPQFAIAKVRVVITSLNRQQRRHCIVEELTQSLGLVNDSPLIFPSIFNDSSRQQELHPWDEIMVQTLYNPRLYPGITVKTARPIYRAILAELIAQTPVTTDSPPAPSDVPPGARPTDRPKAQPAPPGTEPGQMELDPSAFED